MYHLIFDLITGDADLSTRRQLEVVPISLALRGWKHEDAAFHPPFPDPLLSMSDIFSGPGGSLEKHLDAGRISGDLFHSLYSKILRLPREGLPPDAKRSKLIPYLTGLRSRRDEVVDQLLGDSEPVRKGLGVQTIDARWVEQRKRELGVTWDYEIGLMAALASYHLVAYPNQSAAVVMAKCAPFTSEEPFDASRLQLSRNLQVDARLTHRLPIVVDLKTGPQAATNRIAVAGYALAVECEDRTPIDAGCVYYATVADGADIPTIRCDLFPVTDALRTEFISRRNKTLVSRNERADGSP